MDQSIIPQNAVVKNPSVVENSELKNNNSPNMPFFNYVDNFVPSGTNNKPKNSPNFKHIFSEGNTKIFPKMTSDSVTRLILIDATGNTAAIAGLIKNEAKVNAAIEVCCDLNLKSIYTKYNW